LKNLSVKELKTASEKLKKLFPRRVDWPGSTFFETANKFKSRGYEHILGAFPQTIDNDLLLRMANAHLAGDGGSASLQPQNHLVRNLNRNVPTQFDYQAIFDRFLECCTDESICFSMKTGGCTGFWGIGEPTHFDIYRIAEQVITIGHGEDCSVNLDGKDISKVLDVVFPQA
jgi:hypothetical protein